MGFNFPNAPIFGEIWAPPGGPTWQWNGYGWRQIAEATTGIEEAPVDGIDYVRKNAAWNVLPVDIADWAGITGKPATFPPDAHTHTYSSLTGIPATFPPTLPIAQADVTGLVAGQTAQDTAIGTKLASSAYTAADVLAKLVTVDGTGSNLDADLLDGNDSGFFATVSSVTDKVAKAGDTMTGKLVTMTTTAATTAAFNIPFGIAPTPANLVDGDIWCTSAGLFLRVSGATLPFAYTNLAQTFTGTKTFSAPPVMSTPTTAIASMRLPHGVAPTTPTNGDMWTTSAGGLYAQINGATVGPLTGATDISGKENTIAAGTAAQYWQGTKTWQTLDKAAVGLSNVDNTADTAKPVSTAQAAADALNVLKAGDTMSGDLTIAKTAPTLELQKTAGQEAAIKLRTGSAAAGLRWQIASNTTAEGGSNAGSNFTIGAYSDAGALLNTPITIGRSNGLVTFAASVTSAGTATIRNTAGMTAGGATGYMMSNVASFGVHYGSGVPTLSAAQGSIYLRSDGAGTNTRVYVNTNGTTGWAAMSVIATGTSAPSSPATGDVWIDTT